MYRKALPIFFIVFFAYVTACKVPYNPPAITAVNNFLVVEAIINISDSTHIKLSRTVNVMSASTLNPELKAVITIESNQGSSYPVKELGNGYYAAPSYSLNATYQYRLRIKTTNGSTYTSDFVETKVTPPIDSVVLLMQTDGLHIGVNAHDATNNTRYYRWNYSETWQFTSLYDSHWVSTGTGIVVVPRTNDIYHCWGRDSSATILLNTTTGLSQDILQNQPITFVASSSEKLSVRYSILISQYALTSDGYAYWTLLKKNTEQLGSIFDSQPSASIGNLHNINNAAEPVIGFISVGTIVQQRIYLDLSQFPANYSTAYVDNDPYNKNTCGVNVAYVVIRFSDGEKIFQEQDYFINAFPHAAEIPIDQIVAYNPVDSAGAHSGAAPLCVDCTLRGTNVKPSFWKP